MDNSQNQSRVRFNDDLQDASVYKSQLHDRTFLTNNQLSGLLWKPFDLLFPAGKLAKLVRVYNAHSRLPYGDILYKLKLTEGFPVVNLIGAKECGRGKFYAGIARAAFNTDAIIIDSGIKTGIEPYTLRRDVKLIGVAPENEIKFPKINPTYVDPLELSNGHTHIFLLNNEENDFTWTQEAWIKMDLALRLAEGTGPKGSRREDGKPRCKVVSILMADTPYFIDEIKLSIKHQLPIIVVKGSRICNALIKKYAPKSEDNQEDQQQQNNQEDNEEQDQQQQEEEDIELDPELTELMERQDAHFFFLDSNDSEDIAQYVHFLLTVTPYHVEEPKPKPVKNNNGGNNSVNQSGQQQQNNDDDQYDDNDGEADDNDDQMGGGDA